MADRPDSIRDETRVDTRQARLDLLTYLPQFCVVVCRRCRYAVQPNALASHLKRHQVYQKDRSIILQRLSKVNIAEPTNVPLPPDTTAPVPELELHDGFKCLAPACTYSCVSAKRMSQHWSSVHDVADSSLVESRQAWLQTFFKGAEIRYFEVQRGQTLSPSQISSLATSRPARRARDNAQELLADSSKPASLPSQPTPALIGNQTNVSNTSLDLQSLMYLHSFVTSASHQYSRGGFESPEFWIQDVPKIAARQPFLMCGILSASAFHQAREVANTDPIASQAHYDAGMNYRVAGLPGYQEALANPTQETSEAVLVFSRFIGVQTCIELQFEMDNNPEAASAETLTEFLIFLRGCVEVTLRIQPLLPTNSAFIWLQDITICLQRIKQAGLSGEEASGLMDYDYTPTMLTSAVPLRVKKYAGLLYDEFSRRVDLPPAELAAQGEIFCVYRPFQGLMVALNESYNPVQPPVVAAWNAVDGWVHSLQSQSDFLGAIKAGDQGSLAILTFYCIFLLRRIEVWADDLSGLSVRLVRVALKLLHDERFHDILSHAAEEHLFSGISIA